MAALASISDYEAICGKLAAADVGRVERLLEVASDVVRFAAHGQEIDAGTSTETLYNADGAFRFTQRPVTAVSSVVVDGTAVASSGYRWTPGGDGRHALLIRRTDGVDDYWEDAEATVEYSHGWATVPGPIVAAVVAVARGAFATNGGAAVTEWSAEDLSEKYAVETLHAGDMAIPGATQRVLDQLCGAPGPTSTPTLRV